MMTRLARLAGLFLAALVVLPATGFAADPGFIPILNGTWTGKWKCVTFTGVKETFTQKPSELKLRHVTLQIVAVTIDGVQATVSMIPSAQKPTKGELAFVGCRTDNSVSSSVGVDEVGRFKYSVKDTKGTLSGTTFYAGSGGIVGTCRYSYKRVDIVSPAIPTSCS